MKFTKMHGCGNDYIYVNCLSQSLGGQVVATPSKLAIKISDRHFGVGSDGLILIMPSNKADFRMRMFNADGSEGEMCGNGIRCIGKYVYDNKLTKKKNATVETKGGIVTLTISGFNKDRSVRAVEVNIGKIRPIPKTFYIKATGKNTIIKDKLTVCGKKLSINVVSIGNPHCVIFVRNVDNYPVNELGPAIENHRYFPSKTNVEFVETINQNYVKQRTWERGSGETLACGSGACAVMAVIHNKDNAVDNVVIHLKGGKLNLRYSNNRNIYMRGPAVKICDGVFNF